MHLYILIYICMCLNGLKFDGIMIDYTKMVVV